MDSYSRRDKELVLDVDEMFGQLNGWRDFEHQLFGSQLAKHIPFKYAFWIENSILSGVPRDHTPADRHICTSHVPVRPSCESSPDLNSGGGSRKGIGRVWFCGIAFNGGITLGDSQPTLMRRR